jgi:hypothetical protein
MGYMNVLDHTGHSEYTWDPEDKDQVKMARDVFDALTARSHHAFRADEKGRKGGKMTTFDPTAGKIIITPQLVGG